MKTITKGLAAVLASSALLLTACGGTGETTATSESTKADAASGNAITVTDVEGRTVTFDKLPERVILSEGRGVFATSILDREHPLDKVVGMGNDLEASAPSYYDNFKKSVPELADVTTIGNMNHGDVTVENLLALNPDVVVMSADAYKTSGTNGLLQKLDDAKIKYVVSDFRQHPLENTTKSVEMLGTVLGKEDAGRVEGDVLLVGFLQVLFGIEVLELVGVQPLGELLDGDVVQRGVVELVPYGEELVVFGGLQFFKAGGCQQALEGLLCGLGVGVVAEFYVGHYFGLVFVRRPGSTGGDDRSRLGSDQLFGGDATGRPVD